MSQVLWYSGNSAPPRPVFGKTVTASPLGNPIPSYRNCPAPRFEERGLGLALSSCSLCLASFSLSPFSLSFPALQACHLSLSFFIFPERPLPTLAHASPCVLQPRLSGVLKHCLSGAGLWLERENTRWAKQREQPAAHL